MQRKCSAAKKTIVATVDEKIPPPLPQQAQEPFTMQAYVDAPCSATAAQNSKSIDSCNWRAIAALLGVLNVGIAVLAGPKN